MQGRFGPVGFGRPGFGFRRRRFHPGFGFGGGFFVPFVLGAATASAFRPNYYYPPYPFYW